MMKKTINKHIKVYYSISGIKQFGRATFTKNDSFYLLSKKEREQKITEEVIESMIKHYRKEFIEYEQEAIDILEKYKQFLEVNSSDMEEVQRLFDKYIDSLLAENISVSNYEEYSE